jgi:hypothetical protein
MNAHSVVSKSRDVSEPEFHAALIVGLARCGSRLGGNSNLAAALGMTQQGLGKVFNGSVPCMKRLYDAMRRSKDLDDLLDDVHNLYEKKMIDKGQSIERRSCAAPIVAALHKIIEAEEDGVKDHRELLEMEQELRHADKILNALLDRITDIRKPRSVSL